MTAEWFKNNVFSMSDKLYRFANSILNNEEDARDAVQNILMMLWQKRSALNNLDSLEAFAIRSVRNECLNKIQQQQTRSSHHALIQMYTPLAVQPQQPAFKNLCSLMQALPQKQRMVMHLKDVEGYETKEIAALLQMEEGAVRTNLMRARQAMRNQLLKTAQYEKRQIQ